MSNGMANGPGSMPACSEAGSAPQDTPSSQASADNGPETCQTGPKGSSKVSLNMNTTLKKP